MLGYILDIKRSREEDLIVTVLTKDSLKVLYRFYGARHSIILMGHKIDFEEELSDTYLPRMRHIMHINFPWIYNKDTLFAWQKFIKHYFIALKGVSNIPSFYFDTLESISKNINHQCYKRAMVEHFISIKKFEGLMPEHLSCASCHEDINDIFIINRQCVPYHNECSPGFVTFDANEVRDLFEKQNSFSTSDDSIDRLYNFIF